MESTSRRATSTPSIVGLAFALTAIPIFMATYRAATGEMHSNWQVLGREFVVFLLVGLLLLIVKQWELLPLTSIGLHANMLQTSLLRGLRLAAIILAITFGLYRILHLAGVHLGEDRNDVFHPSLVVVTVSMLRAGVAEEIFYRGFAVERLQSLTGSRALAALVPLTIFAVSHYRQGPGGIVAALFMGGALTAFYMKYRDLVANITAHFLIDFGLDVVLPLVSAI
jgi:uncharacterized protein